MREIKFRAWVPVEKTICEVLIIDYKERTVQLPIQTAVTAPYWWDETAWDFDKVVLMQYTGLKDKNGVEIYEGDIVRTLENKMFSHIITGRVYWKGAGFALFTTRGSDTTPAYLEIVAPLCEVIGNIHEHPHLLEASE